MQVQCASVVRLNSSCCERVQVLLIDNQKEHAWNCVAMSAQSVRRLPMNSTGQQTGRSNSVPSEHVRPTDGRAGGKGGWQTKMPPGKTWLWLLAVVAANYLVARFMVPSPEAPVTVPYTLFKDEVAKGNVEAIYSQGDSISGRFKSPVT